MRGYRIELGEIEEVMREDEAVENVVVTALEQGGVAIDLVGYVTLRQPAVATSDLRERLHARLRRRLPAYMVPAFIEVLDGLPTLAGSKVARAHLPAPLSPRLGMRPEELVPPASPLEAELVAVWTEVFGHPDISVEADFFLDLGGHSLSAATVVSRLRRRPGCHAVGIADLYQRPTIRGLADHLEAATAAATVAPHGGPGPAPCPPPLRHRGRRVLGAGLAQLTGLYALLVLLTAPIGWLVAVSGGSVGPWRLAIGGLVLVPALLLLAAVLPVAGRLVLVPGLGAGRHPLWGAAHLRWWLLTRLLGVSPLRLLAGSPLMAPYLRLLGARVGHSCQIATSRVHAPWLVEIGDGVSLGYGAELIGAVVEDGRLLLDPVRIGAGAVVGTGAVVLGGAEIGAGARLAEQSLLARGERIPDRARWGGSPAAPAAASDPLLDAMEAVGLAATRWSGRLRGGFAALTGILALLPFVIALPATVLVLEVYTRWGVVAAAAATLAAGPVTVLTCCLLVAVGKRVALPRSEPGIHPLRSSLGLRKWFADRLMATSLEVTNSLYATLYAVPWLRLLGARVGRRSEVSTVAHIDPDLLTLGEESFVADIASVGAATFAAGAMALGRTELGRRCFVGNAAVVRSHSRLGDRSLIGVQSVAPLRDVDPETSWLGSPAIFLPRRQLSEGFSEEVTYRPSRRRVAARLLIEYVRVTLPATLLSLAVLLAGLGDGHRPAPPPGGGDDRAHPGDRPRRGARPHPRRGGPEVAAGRPLPAAGRAALGPLRRRSELATGLYESVAVPALVGLSPALHASPRCSGCLAPGSAGGCSSRRRTSPSSTSSSWATTPRWPAAALQTHLYEDRVMKMSRVRVGRAQLARRASRWCSTTPRSAPAPGARRPDPGDEGRDTCPVAPAGGGSPPEREVGGEGGAPSLAGYLARSSVARGRHRAAPRVRLAGGVLLAPPGTRSARSGCR